MAHEGIQAMKTPMQNRPQIDEAEIFAVASAMPVEDRGAYFDAACGEDLALRARIERLVGSHEASGFMKAPSVTPEIEEQMARLKPEEAGEMIGPYKLREEIGEGGFGTVWVADQEQPMRRRVALKIIKMGMDTKDVIARFEQERQALAMMDHPNIAKVLDAGATKYGRPFFVMELVKGMPITRVLRRGGAEHARAAGAFLRRLFGDQSRAPEGRDSPRHQAVERHGHAPWRQGGGEGDRLWHRQGHAGAAHRPHGLYTVPADGRHARLHEPRAGRDERAGRGHAERHLRARRAALRIARRPAALRRPVARRGGLRRNAAHHPRGRAGETLLSPQHRRGRRAHAAGEGTPDRAGKGRKARGAGPRLDRHEGHR